MSRLADLIFGNDEESHPLELDKKEHLDKQVELKTKRKKLTTKRDNLQKKKKQLQQEYAEARDRNDEQAAEDALREAEEVDDRLETVEGKLDVVDQMSQTVSNFVNVYEMRDLRDDQYWQRLMSLDRDELVEAFSEERYTIEEMTDVLDVTGTAANDVVSTFSESTDQLHGESSLRDEFEAEYQTSKTSETSTPDPTEIFGDPDADSIDEEEYTDDLQLS